MPLNKNTCFYVTLTEKTKCGFPNDQGVNAPQSTFGNTYMGHNEQNIKYIKLQTTDMKSNGRYLHCARQYLQ